MANLLDLDKNMAPLELSEFSRPQIKWIYPVIGVALFVTALIWSAAVIEIRPLKLLRDLGKAATFMKGFLQPSFTRFDVFCKGCMETLAIALWGTFLAAIFSVPCGLLGARNFSPHPVVYHLVRRFMDVCRAVNEMVFALMFVAAVGLGPFSGMMALAIHTCGYLAKLISETVESIDNGQVEGVLATGAHRIHVVVFGVIPQIIPNYLSYVLMRFESNVRSATVVGMVGGGGIGFYLWESLRSFQDQEASAIIILITVMVVIIDQLSSQIRKRFI